MLFEMAVITMESLLLALREDNEVTIKKGSLYMCRRNSFHNHACWDSMLSCTGSKNNKRG